MLRSIARLRSLAAVLVLIVCGNHASAQAPRAVLSRAELLALYNRMAAQTDIAFNYPVDGCYARAHLMAQRMLDLGVRPAKVWAFARPGTKLGVRTTNHPRGEARWEYHVAPVVRSVLADGVERDVVIDPSMFDGPATVDAWRDKIRSSDGRATYVTRTRLGEPPVDATGVRCPGSGYTPGNDPPDIHAYAVGRMREAFDILAGRRAWPYGRDRRRERGQRPQPSPIPDTTARPEPPMTDSPHDVMELDEAAVRRFELAWRSGTPAPVDSFLPAPSDPRCLPTLEELVAVELEFAWKSFGQRSTVARSPGDTPRTTQALFVEEYLRRFPRSASRPSAAGWWSRRRWSAVGTTTDRRRPNTGTAFPTCLRSRSRR